MDYNGAIAFTITERTADRVEGVMAVQPGILNPFGVVHAGAILWFADVCATVLASDGADTSSGGAGFPLAINLNASLVGNQKDGELRAASVFVKRGRRVSVVRTTVTGVHDRVIAHLTTTHIPA